MADIRVTETLERGNYAPNLREDLTHAAPDHFTNMAERLREHADWLDSVAARTLAMRDSLLNTWEVRGFGIDLDSSGSRARITVTGREKD